MTPTLGALLPPRCEWEAGDPRLPSAPLFPEEEEAVARAVGKRQREFAKGRECARAALGRLGHPAAPLLNGPEREPIWPTGVVGSVTHTDSYCAVVVARAADYTSLGIDAELTDPLEPAIAQRICTPSERAYLDGASDAGTLARLVFSAKEAIYKCQFPVSRQFLGFSDVEVAIPGARDGQSLGELSGVLRIDAGPFVAGHVFRGRWSRGDGLLLAAVWLTRA
jgi:4'-phosphopantetheinyl transferase EntD